MKRSRPWRQVGVGVATAATAVALAACGSSSSATTTSGASSSTSGSSGSGSHYSVAFIPGATGVAFYNSMAAGIKAQAQKYGMSFSTQGSPNFDPSDQTPVVDAVCSRKPSLLLIAPTDPAAMRPSIQRCLSAGVKVVLVDTSLTNKSGIISSISSNNIQGGEAAAKLVGTDLHGKGQAATLSLSPTATTQVQRVQGFRQGLKAFPGISIVSNQYTAQAPSASQTAARAIISAHPQVGAFFGGAEPNAEGVAQVNASGKHLINIGYDADPQEVQLLKQGKISALVVQQPALEGQLGVKYGYDALTGKTSAIKKSVLLPNVLVTTAQASSPKYTKYYYTGTA